MADGVFTSSVLHKAKLLMHFIHVIHRFLRGGYRKLRGPLLERLVSLYPAFDIVLVRVNLPTRSQIVGGVGLLRGPEHLPD